MLGKKKLSPGIAFGLVLRELRRGQRLSQEALALEAGLQRNYISLIERGINQPTITTIFKLAYALRTSPTRIVALVEEAADQKALEQSMEGRL
jgi:transcriptional regulator with XRE-family HTH domain